MKYPELITLFNNSKNQIYFWRTKEIEDNHMPKSVQMSIARMYELYQELTDDERWRLHRPGVFDDLLAEEFAFKRNQEKAAYISPQEIKDYRSHLKKAHKKEKVNGNS